MDGSYDMVERFLAWFGRVEAELRAKLPGIEIQRSEVRSELTDPPHGASVSLSTDVWLASLSVWDTGMCEIILMDNVTTESTVIVDRHFAVSDDLIKALDGVVQLLLNCTTFEELKAELKELEESGTR